MHMNIYQAYGKPKIFGPVTLLGFQIVDSIFFNPLRMEMPWVGAPREPYGRTVWYSSNH